MGYGATSGLHAALDQLRLHSSPSVLGAGTPLFGPQSATRLRQVDVAVSTKAVHVTYAAR